MAATTEAVGVGDQRGSRCRRPARQSLAAASETVGVRDQRGSRCLRPARQSLFAVDAVGRCCRGCRQQRLCARRDGGSRAACLPLARRSLPHPPARPPPRLRVRLGRAGRPPRGPPPRRRRRHEPHAGRPAVGPRPPPRRLLRRVRDPAGGVPAPRPDPVGRRHGHRV